MSSLIHFDIRGDVIFRIMRVGKAQPVGMLDFFKTKMEKAQAIEPFSVEEVG
jgi:hypothetical protein